MAIQMPDVIAGQTQISLEYERRTEAFDVDIDRVAERFEILKASLEKIEDFQ